MIDYSILAAALEHYSTRYTRVEVPWMVERQYVEMTCPNPDRILDTPRGALVGSAEQAFFQMIHQGKISPYETVVSLSPCFRPGDISEYHREEFMKVELGVLVSVEDAPRYRNEMVGHAIGFMWAWTTREIERETTPDGIDLMIRGIEVGSYGWRDIGIPDRVWVYGTGVAEPRFSMVR